MTLAAHCAALQTVAAVCTAELLLAADVAGEQSEESEPLIAAALAAGVAQLALMLKPLALEAIELESAATAPKSAAQV